MKTTTMKTTIVRKAMTSKGAAIALLLALAGAAARAEPVFTYTWNVEMDGQRSTEVVYAGSIGMLTEQRRPDGTVAGEFVVLPDRFIMNDVESERSMVLDPGNLPQIPGLGGAGAGALGDALAQAQDALRDAPPEARRALEGLLGGGGASGAGRAAAAQFRPTGNTGTTGGMDWEEYEATIGGERSIYRVVPWDDVEGAEGVVSHYRAMADVFTSFLNNTGMGAFLQGLDVMPSEIVDFMVDGRRFPIYMQEGGRVAQLTSVGRDDIDAARFGPRFPVQSFGR